MSYMMMMISYIMMIDDDQLYDDGDNDELYMMTDYDELRLFDQQQSSFQPI